MKVFFNIIIISILISLLPISLFSQAESVMELYTANPEVDALLDFALTSAELGEWDKALNALVDAEKLDPLDPRIPSYKSSILELQALDEAQQSWAEGTAVDVKPADTDSEQGTVSDDETPKFVIDRGENDKRNPPSAYRDTLRLDLGIKIFAVNPLSSETINTWSSSNEFFYSSLRADFRYWMPFLGRSLGFNFRSNGYSWAPGEPDILFNALDLGINLRGFLLENKVSRLELGIDFGGSMLTTNDKNLGVDYSWALYLGLWGADPLFYHIFKVESLERLVFGGGLRIYSSDSQEILETVDYRLDAAWYFNRGFSGIRFEWWDFSIDTGSVNMMSFSLFGGFRY
ncbi:MAG: hypothetical protein DRP49_01140 [Spirochaetes bacterium]|nr:MAG: hypothetical protein DRP49_01140 [Spirochaetota bacterium]